MALIDKLTAIADAIREKTATTNLMTLDQMPAAISEISGGVEGPYVKESYDANKYLIGAELVGYTVVRDYAFYGCSKLESINLPPGSTKIGSYSFYNCAQLALTSLPSDVSIIADYAFYNCAKLVLTSLPSGVTSIGSNTFRGCSKLALTSLPSGVTSIGSSAFYKCLNLALTSLPSGIVSIGGSSFYQCYKLALTSLPSSLLRIDSGAFSQCLFTTITFEGTPNSISSYAFQSCTNLTTINVPWAEGAVANAPWGATNATINYNYTGE